MRGASFLVLVLPLISLNDMVVAPRPKPGEEHLIKFHEDPRRTIPVEYQGQFTIWEAYDLIEKFQHYDADGSGCIDAEELKLLLADFDAEPATIDKIMGAIDGNRNGQVEFDEVRVRGGGGEAEGGEGIGFSVGKAKQPREKNLPLPFIHPPKQHSRLTPL